MQKKIEFSKIVKRFKKRASQKNYMIIKQLIESLNKELPSSELFSSEMRDVFQNSDELEKFYAENMYAYFPEKCYSNISILDEIIDCTNLYIGVDIIQFNIEIFKLDDLSCFATINDYDICIENLDSEVVIINENRNVLFDASVDINSFLSLLPLLQRIATNSIYKKQTIVKEQIDKMIYLAGGKKYKKFIEYLSYKHIII